MENKPEQQQAEPEQQQASAEPVKVETITKDEVVNLVKELLANKWSELAQQQEQQQAAKQVEPSTQEKPAQKVLKPF